MDMDVGAADAGGADADQDLVCSDRRDGDVLEGETGGGGGFDEGAHEGPRPR
jgi:hypothetical protein